MAAPNPVDLPLFAVDATGSFTDDQLVAAGEAFQAAWNAQAGGASLTDAEGQAILALGLVQGFSTYGEFRDLVSDLLDDKDLLAAVTTGNFYVITRQLAKSHYIARVSSGMTAGYGDMDAFATELMQWVNAYCMARHNRDVAACQAANAAYVFKDMDDAATHVFPDCSKIPAYQNKTSMGGPPPPDQPIYVQGPQMTGWVKPASVETFSSVFPVFGSSSSTSPLATVPGQGSNPGSNGSSGKQTANGGSGAGGGGAGGGGAAQAPSVANAIPASHGGLIALGVIGLGVVAGYFYWRKEQVK